MPANYAHDIQPEDRIQGSDGGSKNNADASKRLMRELQMVSVPYLVLYHQGKILFEHKGMIGRQELVNELESHVNNRKHGK